MGPLSIREGDGGRGGHQRCVDRRVVLSYARRMEKKVVAKGREGSPLDEEIARKLA